MVLKILPLLVFVLAIARAGALRAEEGGNTPIAYDEVIAELASQLDKDPAAARDAAGKLARFGKRAVPVLAALLKANFNQPKGNQQVVYTAAWALSRIKSGDAAKALVPVLENKKTPPELRTLIVEAAGMEFSDAGVAALLKVAAGDADIELRKKAYGQLSVMPTAWLKAEKLFVDALGSPDAEIRAIAAKQCFFCRIYKSAEDKLIELAEGDPDGAVRTQALLALSRMRVRLAVPMLMRVLSAEGGDEKMDKLALSTLVSITGVPLKDKAGARVWWEKYGKKEYGKLEALKKEVEALKAADPAAQGSAARKAETRP